MSYDFDGFRNDEADDPCPDCGDFFNRDGECSCVDMPENGVYPEYYDSEEGA